MGCRTGDKFKDARISKREQKEGGGNRWKGGGGRCRRPPHSAVHFYLDFVLIPKLTFDSVLQMLSESLLCGQPGFGAGTQPWVTHTDLCLEEEIQGRTLPWWWCHTRFMSQVMKSILRDGEWLAQGHIAHTMGEEDQNSGLFLPAPPCSVLSALPTLQRS